MGKRFYTYQKGWDSSGIHMGPRQMAMYGHGTRQMFSFSLVQYTTVSEAEVYAIKACAVADI
jgi:hypothetical protein